MSLPAKSNIQKPVVIQCFSIPLAGHITPFLKIIEILQQKHPEYQIKFFTSAYFLQKIKDKNPGIKMQGINNNMTEESLRQKINFKFYRLLYNPGLSPMFRIHQQYFKQKTDKPDLMICDFFEECGMEYAKKNNIKCIIVSSVNYKSLRDCYGLPSFDRSFSFAGFSILRPKLFNHFETKGFFNIYKAGKQNCRVFISSGLGLEDAVSMPPNISFIGLFSHCNKEKGQIGEQLSSWMKQWKSKGQSRFIYISFGTIINLAEQFAFRLVKIVQELGYPTIWSTRSAFASKIDSKLIFHRPWFAQEAVLALPQVKCYISHGGWGSVTESVASETPLICIPSFGDQILNSQLVHDKKIGIQIYSPKIIAPRASFLPEISDETIRSALQKVINDESYYQNIKKVNALCKTYKTEAIVNNIVEETLEYGYEHLIDRGFEKHTGNSIKLSFNLLVILLIAAAVYFGAKYLGF